jgi:hypothetical protein
MLPGEREELPRLAAAAHRREIESILRATARAEIAVGQCRKSHGRAQEAGCAGDTANL